MTEVAFAKSFLSNLDSRPAKLSADHVEDPRTYPARSPYILPRMPRAMSKRVKSANPGQERSVTVTLKSLRNPPLDIKLTSQPLGTSVLDLKTAVAAQAGLDVAKVRLLHAKKPVPDSKVLKEILGDDESATVVEFSVMVIGGASAAVPAAGPAATTSSAAAAAAAAAATAQGVSGAEAVQSEEFWEDLRGYLLQRIRDEKQANELFGVFRKAWEDKA